MEVEYTIYTESLVYYAIRERTSGMYISKNEEQGEHLGYLKDAVTWPSLGLVKLALLNIKSSKASYANASLEIRKVKVIDIGEVYVE